MKTPKFLVKLDGKTVVKWLPIVGAALIAAVSTGMEAVSAREKDEALKNMEQRLSNLEQK